MKYNFDQIINRKNTASFKWDKNTEYFGKEDVIPLWVADMDFMCAQPVIDAIKERINHPVLGYTVRTQEYYNAVIGWMKKRHNWDISKEWITFSPPGIIYAIYTIVQLITNKNDKVIMQSPNYDPLFELVSKSERQLIINPLKYENNRYHIDIEDLKGKIEAGAKALILSSPNNPTGRVWTMEELTSIGELCLKHNVFVVADEIYSDFIFPSSKHIPFASINNEFALNSAVCISTSKGFNLGGLQMSTVIIPNEHIRTIFNEAMMVAQTRLDNIFGSTALEAAYTKGEEWLNQAIAYVESNKEYVENYISTYIPKLKVVRPEATFLLWIDCTGLGLRSKELESFMINKAGVAFSQGYEFGPGGNGFVRMNIACPQALLKKALEQVEMAVDKL